MASPIKTHPGRRLPPFHCTECRGVFSDPVSIPCGHSFCKTCLSGLWDGSEIRQCPMCKKTFEGPQDISVSTILAQMIQYFKGRGLEAHKLETKVEGEDSCLRCQISLCDGKEESCSAGDLLVDPVLDLKDSKCEKHNQPLELFCSTDHTCICTECVEDGHGEHSTTPVEREWLNRLTELRKNVLQVKQQILDRQRKMEEIKRQTRLSKEDGERELKEGLQILEVLKRLVEKSQAELPEVIKKKQREVEGRAQNLLEKLGAEIGELKTKKSELKELLCSQDHVQVLQTLPSQLATPCLQDWNKIILRPHLCVGVVSGVLSLHKSNLAGKLRELMDAEYKKIRCYANDVRLNPRSAQGKRVISLDRKKVHYQGKLAKSCNIPDSFWLPSYVLGEQVFTSGRHYWEVNVEGKLSWCLGVVTRVVKTELFKKCLPKNGLWLLHLMEGNILTALDASPVRFRLQCPLKKVGVYVDYEEGQISFYSVETRSALYSFTGNTFTGELFSVLDPGGLDRSPMALISVSQTELF